MRRVLLTLLLLTIFPLLSEAQIRREEQGVIKVYFRLGESKIDESYMNNGNSLNKFVEEINSYTGDSNARVGRISIISSTSPEGTKSINDRLADQRAKAITEWLMAKTSETLTYTVESMRTDWSMLIDFVESSKQVPYKDEVLNVLRNTPEFVWKNGVATSYRLYKLKSLRDSKPYNWLFENIFPDMRYAAAETTIKWEFIPTLTITSQTPMNFAYTGSDDIITFEKSMEDETLPTAECEVDWIESLRPTKDGILISVATNPLQEPRSTVVNLKYHNKIYPVVVNQEAAPALPKPIAEVIPQPTECKPFYMSVQTNALYLLGIVPNIGVEFYLGKNWSVDANWHYSWWKSDPKKWYWRTYGGDIALRKWLGKKAKEKPLTGHHLGIYGQIITYDFEWGGRGYIGGEPGGSLWDEINSAVGLEYGYSLPIAKRMNIDFTLGVGYHWGEYSEYLPIDDHYVAQATKNRHYIGPTKAEISLVWLLGCKNVNAKKGGKR